MKLAVIGGGSSYTPELVQGLLDRHQALGIDELSLMDVDPQRLAVVGGLVERMIRHRGAPITLRLEDELVPTLQGAAFVVSQIRVGQMEARRLDETIPLRYGVIGQETTGVGGMFKALRTVPAALEIAHHMEQLCPRAWYLNFTNPSGLITEAILKHSRVPVVGLCNLPINFLGQVARHFQAEESSVGLAWTGLNHLGWVRGIRIDGRERLPDYLDHLAGRPDGTWDAALLRALEAVPTHYLRYYYYRDQALAEARAAQRTRAEVVLELERQLLARYADPASVAPPPALAGRGGARYSEAALNLVAALRSDRAEIQVLNVRNGDTLPDLPPEVCVEAPCRVTSRGPEPIPQGPASGPMRALLVPVKAYESLTIEAAIQGSRRLALQALLAHPLAPSFPGAQALLEDMLSAQRQWLPRFFR